MNEIPGSPRFTRPPVSLTELRRMNDALNQLRAVTLSDGSTSGGEVASGDGGLAISFPNGLRSFWGIITSNLGSGAYVVDQIEDVGQATLAPNPQSYGDLLTNVNVGEMSQAGNVAVGTTVRCFPSYNQDLEWSFVDPKADLLGGNNTWTGTNTWQNTSTFDSTSVYTSTSTTTFRSGSTLTISTSVGGSPTFTGTVSFTSDTINWTGVNLNLVTSSSITTNTSQVLTFNGAGTILFTSALTLVTFQPPVTFTATTTFTGPAVNLTSTTTQLGQVTTTTQTLALSTMVNNQAVTSQILVITTSGAGTPTITGFTPIDPTKGQTWTIVNTPGGTLPVSYPNGSGSSTYPIQTPTGGTLTQPVGTQLDATYDPNTGLTYLGMPSGSSASLSTGTGALGSPYSCTGSMTATALSVTLAAGTYLLWVEGYATIQTTSPGDRIVVGVAVASSSPAPLNPPIAVVDVSGTPKTASASPSTSVAPSTSTTYYVYAQYVASGTVTTATLLAGTILRWLKIG